MNSATASRRPCCELALPLVEVIDLVCMRACVCVVSCFHTQLSHSMKRNEEKKAFPKQHVHRAFKSIAFNMNYSILSLSLFDAVSGSTILFISPPTHTRTHILKIEPNNVKTVYISKS